MSKLRMKSGANHLVKKPHQHVFSPSSWSLAKVKDIAGVIQSVVTVFALIVTGIWFMMQGENSHRANIEHYITHKVINKDSIWVRVSIKISNVGKRRLFINSGVVSLYQVLPLDISIYDTMNRTGSFISQDSHTIAWPAIDKPYDVKDIGLNLGVGEYDAIYYDFVIPSEVKTIIAYSYFTNEEYYQKGWSLASVYDLTHKKE